MKLLLSFLLVLGSHSSSATSCESKLTMTVNSILAKSEGTKIEIGAADRPICTDCLQIDRYLSEADLRQRITEFSSVSRIWAAAKSGVIGDAQALPFKNDTIDLIVSKNFPWFGGDKAQLVETVLREYRRVIKC